MKDKLTTVMDETIQGDLKGIKKDFIVDSSIEIGKDLLDSQLPIVKPFLKIVSRTNEYSLLKKCLEFLYGIKDIPQTERYEFVAELKQKGERPAGEIILSTIEKADHPRKVTLIARLFKARVYNEITFEDFMRMTFMLEKVPYFDLELLKEIKDDGYFEGNVELLESAGFIRQDVIDGGNAKGQSKNHYILTTSGNMILEYLREQ